MSTSLKSVQRDFETNTLGNLHLFKAIASLLEASQRDGGGVWFPISAALGSIKDCPRGFSALAYGMSKAALNFFSWRISEEHEKIKVIIVNPGVVKTDMSDVKIASLGLTGKVPTITVEDSVQSMLAILDSADQYESGSFINYDGKPFAWCFL